MEAAKGPRATRRHQNCNVTLLVPLSIPSLPTPIPMPSSGPPSKLCPAPRWASCSIQRNSHPTVHLPTTVRGTEGTAATAATAQGLAGLERYTTCKRPSQALYAVHYLATGPDVWPLTSHWRARKMTSPQFPDGSFGVLHSSLSQINTPSASSITIARGNQGIDIHPLHEKVWPS